MTNSYKSTLLKVRNFLRAVAIMNQEQVPVVEREGFSQLLRDPNSGRVSGGMAVQNPPPLMGDYKEAVQDLEVERWHSEEIHVRNGFTMNLEECLPTLAQLYLS